MKTNNNWIVLDKDAITHIQKAVSDWITQGEIMLRASCPRKWYYRYALKLERRGFFDPNLVYGSLMHSLLEELYQRGVQSFSPVDKPITISPRMVEDATNGATSLLRPQDKTDLELVKAKVQIHFDAYRRHYRRLDSRMLIKGVEKILTFTFNGLKLTGKVDLIAQPNRQDGLFIWDFKTAGMLDAKSLDAWTFKFQFLFYCWLYWKVIGEKPDGMMINGLVKSMLRPKQVDRKSKRMETQKEFLFRLQGDMAANREKYFYRQRIPLGTDALERFEEEILKPHLYAFKTLQILGDHQDLKPLISAFAMQMNTNHCHTYGSYCEYLNLCKDGKLAMREFDKREMKHVEI